MFTCGSFIFVLCAIDDNIETIKTKTIEITTEVIKPAVIDDNIKPQIENKIP